MGCRVMYDPDDDAACLYDSVTETVFGRRFLGHGQEKADAFLAWCASNHGDPRKLALSTVVELQDEWLESLDSGCAECFAEPWEKCDEGVDAHERKARMHPGLRASIESVTGRRG